MGYGSIVSIFDRLSIKTVLTNHTGSYLGFLATLAFIAVCLILLIPPVNLYFTGAYFESQFVSDQFPKSVYNTGSDITLAMVFRDRKTAEVANHTEILENLNSYGYYFSYDQTFKTDLMPCQPAAFLDAINPMDIKDCVMLPSDLEFDITATSGVLPYLQMAFTYKCEDSFKCSPNSPHYNKTVQYIVNLAKNYYFEFIFNSKVLDEKGNLKKQFHKIYSTEFASPDGLASYFQVEMSQKKYFIDDSILPWWNNRTYDNLFWAGKVSGSDGNQIMLESLGYFSDLYTFTEYRYSYRYYKKLDFILGMIGGAVFLIFLFFWVVFTYFNRTLQKMRNAEQLLFEKDTIITTDQNLHKIRIPWYYPFTKFLPGNTTNKIIEAAQNQIDIVKLIKKLKVTHRNLRVKGNDLTFKSKDVDLTSQEPQQFLPDRPVLQNYEITLEAYQALSKSPSTGKIYENNPAALALTENNNDRIDTAIRDEHYQKDRTSKFNSLKDRFADWAVKFVKFWDVFGARPMLQAEPETSSCWGFLLTLVIIVCSVLTFALTLKNMDSIKIITSTKYQQPLEHNYEMTTGKDFRFTFCVPSAALSYITGANKTVQISFFKQSKKNGYQEVSLEKMESGQFADYYELSSEDPFSQTRSQYCFKPVNGQRIPMGGSYDTVNQAYFGVRLDPYCSGIPSECVLRRNQSITDFLKFINYNTYGIYVSENKYSPEQGKIISGITSNEVSESDYVMNASLLRTQTFFVSAVQFLDDTSKSFERDPPVRLLKTMAFSNFGDRNEQRKGNATADPGYILEFRPNGQVQQIIKRSYKIDFLLGMIGGCFVFWYFFIHFFAKFYNSYKVRAKLAQVLHQEDGYDESILVHFLYLIKFPASLCCCFSGIRQDIDRVALVDNKMQRDLNYLNLIKNADTCYRLSSAMYSNISEKDLSLIYFREKIDEAELVKPKRINELQDNGFEDDEFLQFDDEGLNQDLTSVNNGTSNLLPEVSMPDINLEKIVNMGRSNEQSPLYDQLVPNKKQNHISNAIKKLDAFKNPPELTLNGERDVKSIIGAIMFIILASLIITVVNYFLEIYSSGSDYTVSRRRLVDSDLNVVDSSNTLGELSPGIHLTSGKNFKFAVSFNKKDRYYTHNVTQYIGPIGIRMLQYTVSKENSEIVETYEAIELQQCRETYLDGFLSTYNDKEAFANITLAYCLPDGKQLSISGIPQDRVNTYFKLNIYNKYDNATGKAYLNSFFKIYLVTYYMSVPKMDIFAKNFQYQMIKFNYQTDTYSYPIQENITMTKVIFTDKYYSRSRQTYNDRSPKQYEKVDINYLSTDNARNLTFYYSGMLDHYTLDYPGGAELFGLVGGVIALFIFFFHSCVTSFNEYRMKYLIGQRLYTFDKKLSGLSKEKGKKLNLKKIQEATKKINNFNELEILLAWVLNPIGYIRDNYNFNKTLRRVTLVIDRVQNDINLYNVYKNLFTYKNIIDKKIKLAPSEQRQYDNIKLSSIFIKHIYNPDTIENHIPLISKESKKHRLSSYEQVKIKNAIDANVDPRAVLGEKVLNRAFGLDDETSVLQSRIQGAREELRQEDSSVREEDRDERKQKKKNDKKKLKTRQEQDSQARIRQPQQPMEGASEATRNIEAFQIEQSASKNNDQF